MSLVGLAPIPEIDVALQFSAVATIFGSIVAARRYQRRPSRDRRVQITTAWAGCGFLGGIGFVVAVALVTRLF